MGATRLPQYDQHLSKVSMVDEISSMEGFEYSRRFQIFLQDATTSLKVVVLKAEK